MNLAAFIISVIALVSSLALGWRAIVLARHANSVSTLIDLFGQHRGERLARAREFVRVDLMKYDLSKGLSGLPAEEATLVRELAWYYDNVGALVTHGIVDIRPVSGYMGVSVANIWERLEPLVLAERARRTESVDPNRWQAYFENLYLLVRSCPPEKARSSERNWRVGK